MNRNRNRVLHAPSPICREFEADVLAQLERHGATMHGCPVASVACGALYGTVATWFVGKRDGIGWKGALIYRAQPETVR